MERDEIRAPLKTLELRLRKNASKQSPFAINDNTYIVALYGSN